MQILSPRIFFTAVVLLGAVELVIWRGLCPVSFHSTFDAVRQDQVQIEPDTIELGDMSIGEERLVSVRVTNGKSRPIRLQRPIASCGCIRFDLAGPVIISPGEVAALEIKYTAPNEPGDFSKNVLLRVSSAASAWRIPLTGRVVAESWASPSALDILMTEDQSGQKSGIINLSAGQSVGHVVCSHPEVMDVTLGQPSTNAQSYCVRLESKTEGEGYVAFLGGRTAEHLVTVPVSWRKARLIECSPATVTWNNQLSGGEKREIVVLRDPEKTADLQFSAKVPWVHVGSKRTVSDQVVRFSVVADRRRMPNSFSGEIVRIVDARSGQSTALKGKF